MMGNKDLSYLAIFSENPQALIEDSLHFLGVSSYLVPNLMKKCVFLLEKEGFSKLLILVEVLLLE
jgi:hypothetical protein